VYAPGVNQPMICFACYRMESEVGCGQTEMNAIDFIVLSICIAYCTMQ